MTAPEPALNAELVRLVAEAFMAHDFPHGSPEHYATIAVETLTQIDPPPAPLVADPKLITHLIMAGTKVPPPLPPRHSDGGVA